MDAEYWREQAWRCQRLARQIDVETTRLKLLELATEYEKRAEAASAAMVRAICPHE